jgi:hypothetical protein
MSREPQQWGGEVHVPRWLRRVLRRPLPPEDTPERRREGAEPKAERSVLENANRAASGALADLYNEGRKPRR